MPPAEPTPSRRIRYREIAEDLRSRIAAGELGGRGDVLPSEAELSASHGASRVTVRRALEVLRDEGLVDARQGYGWFLAGAPIRQHLGHLGTIESQLESDGRRSERRILDFEVVDAPERARRVLGCDRVLRVVRVTLADDEPFARVTVWCPEPLARGLTRDQVSERTFLELLPVPLGGAEQVIEARAAGGADAELLEVAAGTPVLVCERITRDLDGRPVLLAEHVVPGHRGAFSVDLPHPGVSMAPSGLRLVDDHPETGR